MDRYPGFDEFVLARSAALSRAAYLLTGDHEAARDLLQSALARTLPKWRRLRDGNPEGYVRRVLYTEFVTGWRRHRLAEYPTERLPEHGHPDPSEDAALRLSLERALGRLTARQRAVIVLRFYEDRSVQEAAAILGCSEGTVKRRKKLSLRSSEGLQARAQL